MGLPLRMDNTLVQSTGRPYNGSPPPTLREEVEGKDTRLLRLLKDKSGFISTSIPEKHLS